MKKLIALATTAFLLSPVCAGGGEGTGEINYASDFPEYVEMRDEMAWRRNGNYTQRAAMQKVFCKTPVEHRDKADAIYYSLYLIENLDEQYVSQELLTSLVQSFTNLSETESDDYYSKVYLSDNLQIDWIFAFKMKKRGQIVVDMYSDKTGIPPKSAVFEIKRKDKFFQSELELLSGDLPTKPKIQKSVIRGMWYALWNYNGEPVVDFALSEPERKVYDDTLSMLKKFSRKEFFKVSDCTDRLVTLYESNHQKVSTMERQAFLELVLRCHISGL